MELRIKFENGTIYLSWRAKGGHYFKAPIGMVLKYGRKRIQYEINQIL